MDLRKYIYGHCIQPVRVKIWDAYSSSYVWRFVPCGKCLHCKNSHISEWCTRLFAERKHSKYCYYVSLDYAPFKVSNPIALKLARETAACYHNINKTGHYAMHPLVLCKNHLQDFYKRLRKNTGIKLHYFACGEYGMHAEGKGYGRPHFHNIIFTNELISPADFVKAWSIDGYNIGRVDIQDLSSLNIGDGDNLKIFKYVCKYLQKSDFDFESLATIDFHRAYYKSLNTYIKQKTDLFGCAELVSVDPSSEDYLSWKRYCTLFAPFVVCSRRPSIGSAYLEENMERFKEQDFRLFGLPKECTAFPRYYVRRAKESLINFRCLGEISKKPSSAARLDYINKILNILLAAQRNVDNWSKNASLVWRVCKKNERNVVVLNEREFVCCSDLNFYDAKNKYMYQFDGYKYNVWSKIGNSYALFDIMDISEVLSETQPSWDRYYSICLRPAHDKRVLLEKELNDTIYALFPDSADKTSEERFNEEVYSLYQSELATYYKTKLLMQNSKTEL